MSERFTTDIPVRYADVDSYGHVNNAAYATYLEEARIDYLEVLFGDVTEDVDAERSGAHDAEGSDAHDGEESHVGAVVANLEIDYRLPIESADAVTVAVGLREVGTSSFTLTYEIRSVDGVHAEAETTMVAFDRDERTSRPLPEAWREVIRRFEGIDAD